LGGNGFTVYKSALVGLDVAIKKSGWSGIAIKIKQDGSGTVLAYNAVSPSAMVRLLALGLIPLLILNAKSWMPLLRDFEQYVQGSAFFGGSPQLQQGQQQYQQQAVAPQQQQAQQYPCQQCQAPLQWVAEHQRWYCGGCQQYKKRRSSCVVNER
tara:strand:+ start:432 stop:893 length:462 start_codon:yes stop_codon:yes gene_type:complete